MNWFLQQLNKAWYHGLGTTEGDKTLKVFWLVSFLYDRQSKANRRNQKLCV